VSVAERRLLAREAAISAVTAAVVAAVLAWVGPPGVDLAAHAYQRTFLLDHGFAVWNNYWYGGRFSFVTYSPLYYPLAALFGIRLLAVMTVAAAALAFTIVVWQEWGPAVRLSTRTFAVLWGGIVLSAAFPFALGAAFALLALSALQQGRHRVFSALVFLTLLASPLAFVLLVVVLSGGALGRRPRRATVVVVAAAAMLELGLRRIFPGQGRFPFTVSDLVPGAAFAVLGIAVTARVPAARRLFGIFSVFLAAVVVAFAVPSDLGSNVERVKYAAIPLALLAAVVARRRALLAVPLVLVGGFWNISAIAHNVERASDDPAHARSYWQPAIRYLRSHLSPSFRVEVVDTVDHWAAAYLPDAGIPLVRGWYRQGDFPQNELLYDHVLTPGAYTAWLRSLGVRYVVLPDAPPDYSARREAALVRSGWLHLTRVFASRHVTVFAVPSASPIVTGAAPATVMWLEPTRIVAVVDAPGRYRVKVRWSPYWRTHQGCVWRGPDGFLRLRTAHAGLVELRVSVDVHRGLQALAGRTPRRVCGR
jgi:hypothetical protein